RPRRRVHLHHVVCGNVLRQADDHLRTGFAGVEGCLLRHHRRHEHQSDVEGPFGSRLNGVGIDLNPEMLRARLAWVDAGHDMGAVGLHMLGPESALLSGYSLDENAMVLTQDHAARSCAARTDAFTASSIKS